VDDCSRWRGNRRAAGCAAALVVGRSVFTRRLYALLTSPLEYSLDTLSIDKFSLDFYANVRTIGVHVYCDSSNRVMRSSVGRFFAMGLCTSRDGTGEFEFTPVPGAPYRSSLIEAR